ncbi:endopeptidase La [Christensenellaceae bacterium OttesenSCG-928-K19]|nr:endopeptidase La [Christensenellaceae bacterium OttesenSCG-928-K19]
MLGMKELIVLKKMLQRMPMVALRGLVVFPYMVLHFDVGRDMSVAAVEECMVQGKEIFLTAQKDIKVENPEKDDLYEIGTVAKVKQVLKLPGDMMRVLVEGVRRGKLIGYIKREPYMETVIQVFDEKEGENQAQIVIKEVYMRRISDLFERFASLGARVPSETLYTINEVEDVGKFADLVAANVAVKLDDKQRVLDAINELDRLKAVMEILEKEIEIQEIDKELAFNVKQQIDKSQKEYFLREQMKAIQKELGDSDNDLDEIEELRTKIEELDLPEDVRTKAEKELARLSRMSPGSPETNVIHNYLDWIVSLPWGVKTEDNMDLTHARKILDQDHYGLTKVKDRIIEFLAVRKLKNDMKGPILCLAGPPGVGKTSIVKSIARALDKKFVRMSLGGVRDEAEIRGHRRTYIGAIPGRIVSSVKQAGSMNPVFLLDEIDKMSSDFRGDPASAMLEVLDPEINNTFRDHYLDVEFDLSNIMFITTANNTGTIPGPLYDRMEIINIDSYTDVEKLNIAKKHLIAKQAAAHGLQPKAVKISDAVLMDIIHRYTAESGVRSLEREIATIMRKSAATVVKDGIESISVSRNNLKDFLGLPKRGESTVMKKDTVGVVTGLAWTAVGGQTLPVEVSVMPGTGKLEITGQLGDVMKESAKTAISVVRTMGKKLKFDADINEKTDLHIHVPEGAIPKDGPSAGVTMVTAIASALTGRKVRHDIAMTGEITLTGRVLKIGGIKEKALAALRAGIHTIILPKDNQNDLDEMPESVMKQLTFHFVSKADEVLKLALKD